MTTATPTKTITIRRRVCLCREEQNYFEVEIELPEGVTAEQVDAELVELDPGKYGGNPECWDSWELPCGAQLSFDSGDYDENPEMTCAPIWYNAETHDRLPGSAEWPGQADHLRGDLEVLADWIRSGRRLEDAAEDDPDASYVRRVLSIYPPKEVLA